MKEKIISIIGHGIEPELAELQAEEIIELFKTKIMETDKFLIGDRVSSKAHPEIKSKIKEIKRSRFTDDMMYFCSNGCIYTIDEIIKI